MMEKIRFGILGCGSIAARFAKALAASDTGELLACAARDGERAAAFAREHGAKRAYEGYEELLRDPEVQAVYIATVHSTHAEIAKLAVKAGKPVLCEKPFFVNGHEAREVISLAKERGVLIMEGFWTRTQPAFQKAMEWIQAGKLGEPRLIRAAFCGPVPYSPKMKDHRLWNPETAGGALFDIGVYPYQFATGIVGRGPREMQSVVEWGPTGVDVTVAMSLRFENGLVADCLTSFGGWMDDTAVISGTEGAVKLERFYGSRKVQLFRSGRLEETFEDPQEEGFVHEIDHFAELIREEKIESDINPLALTLDFAEAADRILQKST